jgi:hypothetical protein
MKVRVRQRGGIAGAIEIEADTSRLPVDAAVQIEEAVARLGLHSEGASPAPPEIGADLATIEIEVEDGERRSAMAARPSSAEAQRAAELMELVARFGSPRW